jgi:RecB family exonuclease
VEALQISYSRVGCYGNCPYQYKLRYLDKLRTLPDQDPTNALYLGTAIHTAFETGSVEEAIKSYRSNYYMLTDAHINEEIKLEMLIPKVLALLPEAECEVEISTDDFIGYIDRLEHLYKDEQGIDHYAIWDYKYCNPKSIDRYLTSGQLHIYKYYFELTHPQCVVDHLKYVFIPKVNIRQKKDESLQQFRSRLRETLEATEPQVTDISYDVDSISQFQQCCQHLNVVNEFPKNKTRLCDWCSYQTYCESNGEVDWMIIKD